MSVQIPAASLVKTTLLKKTLQMCIIANVQQELGYKAIAVCPVVQIVRLVRMIPHVLPVIEIMSISLMELVGVLISRLIMELLVWLVELGSIIRVGLVWIVEVIVGYVLMGHPVLLVVVIMLINRMGVVGVGVGSMMMEQLVRVVVSIVRSVQVMVARHV